MCHGHYLHFLATMNASATTAKAVVGLSHEKQESHPVGGARSVVLNLVGGTEPHQFHMLIHRTLL